jgi:hypothetical protein
MRVETIDSIEGKKMVFNCKKITDGSEYIMMKDDFCFVSKYANMLLKIHTTNFSTITSVSVLTDSRI